MLIVLRGTSASGKSTLAAALQARLGWPTAVLGQDHFRRVIYNEREHEHMAHAALLEAAATHSLAASQPVVLEGIFNAQRYSPMLERLATRSPDSRFFAFDLSLEETLRRHRAREHPDVTPAMISGWYHGWQPLPFVQETRLGPGLTVEESVDLVLDDAPRRPLTAAGR